MILQDKLKNAMTAKMPSNSGNFLGIARNSAFLTFARCVSGFSAGLFNIYAARVLGSSNYGRLALILLICGYLYIVTECGQQRLLIQGIAGVGVKHGDLIGGALAVKAIFGSFTILCCLAISGALDPTIKIPLRIVAISVFPVGIYYVFDGLCQARERMDLVAMVEIPYAIVKSITGAALFWVTKNISVLMWLYFGIECLRALFITAIYRIKFGRIELRVVSGKVKEMAVEGISLMAWALLFGLYYRLDVMILTKMRGYADTGFYAVCYRIIDMQVLVIVAITGALLPVLSRVYKESKQNFRRLASLVFRIFFVSAGMILSVMLFAGPAVISFLYGPDYLASGRTFQVLTLAFVPGMLTYLLGTVMMSSGKYRTLPWIYGMMVIAKGILSLLIVPRYGYLGSAFVHAFCETAILAALLRYSREELSDVSRGFVLKVGIVCMGATGAAYFIGCYSVIAMGLVIPVLFVTLLLIGNIVSAEQIKSVWNDLGRIKKWYPYNIALHQ